MKTAIFAGIAVAHAAQQSKTRPVMKIVRLLQDMQVELQTELEDDKAVFEKLQCWCKTGGEDKKSEIEMCKATIANLNSSNDGLVAKMEELKEKRKVTLDEVNANHASKTEADEQRIKENKAFQGEETDLIEAVKACKQALIVLGNKAASLTQVRDAVRSLQLARIPQMVTGSTMDRRSLDTLKQFLGEGTSFLQIPGMKSYAPQSGQIVGILDQMQVDFEKNLKSLQEKEAKAVSEYEAMTAAKEDEIKAGRETVTQIDSDLASLLEKHAEQAKEIKDTQEQQSNAETFLATLEEKCANAEADFEKRVKDRMVEITAVEDTIKILNDDEAFDAFDKSLNHEDQTGSAVGFLQTDSENRRERASAVLRGAAMVGLASKVQLDAFTEVKAEIDKLVAEYKKQSADEIVQRDECIADFNENEKETTHNYDKKDALETKIADLTKTIETATADKAEAAKEIEETKVMMKRASDNREKENFDNVNTVQAQRVTQTILQKALDRMKEAYAFLQGPGAPHTQTSATKTDPGNGPAKFKQYDENAGGKRVLTMLEDVLSDSKQMENEALNSETNAQAAYEILIKDSNKLIVTNTKKITNLSETLAKAKESLSQAKTDLVDTVGVLGELNDVKGALHKSCDYLLKNFEVRQAARSAEIDAMIEAKNILSGMK